MPIKPDVVICLGKTPKEDGILDTILEGRVLLAYRIAKESKIPLILTGGKSHKSVTQIAFSEAKAMYKYLKNHLNIKGLTISLEEKGESTIQQLCIIKNRILIPNKWFVIGLVTDKVHLKRAVSTAEWIFGRKFVVYGYGSEVKLNKDNLLKYKRREQEKFKLSKSNFIKNFKKGDDKGILKYDNLYRKTMQKHIKARGNPKDILKIPGYY